MRNRGPRATILLLGALIVSGCGDAVPPESRRLPEEFFGVNGQLLLQTETASPGGPFVEGSLAAIEDSGLRFVRANLIWPDLEPAAPLAGEHQYQLAGLDAWVSALAEHHLRWQALIMGVPTPAWAAAVPSCSFHSAPAGPQDLASMAAAIARRYGRDGSLWRERPELPYLPVTDFEIWNEPNLDSFWCPAPDPEAYAELFVAAADAVVAVDPRADLIVGGLASIAETSPPGAPFPQMATAEFVSRMVAHEPGIARQADMVAVHPYASTATGVLAALRGFRAALDEAGLDPVPMSVNEVGWPTLGTAAASAPVAEPARADYLAEAAGAIARSGCGVIAFAPHTWATPESDPANGEDWFGIADPRTGAPYPTARAYADAIDSLAAGGPLEPTPC